MRYSLLLLLLGSLCFADDSYVLDGGVGIANSAKKGLSETKMLTLGKQYDLIGPIKERAIVGGWLDNSGGGKNGSGLVSGQIGFEVNRNGLVAGLFTGPCLISNTDTMLGGHFQFMDDLHLGLEDHSGNYLGVMYRHISSAGISTPNLGRDIMAIEMRF